MRRLSVLAAALVATILPSQAQAAEVLYGFNLLRTNIYADRLDQAVIPYLQMNRSGSFRFDTTNNQLLSFDYSFGSPLDYDPGPGFDFSPSEYVIALFNAAGTCNLGCFVQTLNSSSYYYNHTSFRGTLSFAAPLSGTITAFGPGGFPGRQIDEVGIISVSGPIPEPSTWLLMLLGFGAIGTSVRRHRATSWVPASS